MDKDLIDFIFTYLDKRYPIKNGLIHLRDINPYQHLKELFDVNDDIDWVTDWAISRIGEHYRIKFVSGTEIWYKNGKYHRLDGPAVIRGNGTEIWYKDGLYHREDGPAVIHSNGEKYWWVDGMPVAMNDPFFTKKI